MKKSGCVKSFAVGVALVAAAVCVECRGVPAKHSAPDPETVFRNPPQSAKTGVWWHWMGCNVSKEGIVRDLDWFKETGIGAATIFGMVHTKRVSFMKPLGGLI